MGRQGHQAAPYRAAEGLITQWTGPVFITGPVTISTH